MSWKIIYKARGKKEGFLLQTGLNQYLLAEGPFSRSLKPAENKWSLFHPPFFLSDSCSGNWYVPSTADFFSKRELLNFLSSQTKKRALNLSDLQWRLPSFSDFEIFFFKAKKQIAKSRLQKVVPVFFETAEYELKEMDMPALVYRLVSRSLEQAGFAYAFWSGKKAIAGFTPEWLFQKEGPLVQTMALAGTAHHSGHDLLKDLKEQKEHQIVVEELKTCLEKTGNLQFSKTYIYSAGDIRHLRTDFKLHLKENISFEKLCFFLHPTPALGGVPKKQALSMLADLDKKHHPRLSFGAPFGITMGEKAFCLVAIRNIQFMNNKAYIGSGAGLVKESRLEKEWEELKKKRQIIKDILFLSI